MQQEGIFEPESRPGTETKSAGTLPLEFPASRTEAMHLLFKGHPVDGIFVIAAYTD